MESPGLDLEKRKVFSEYNAKKIYDIVLHLTQSEGTKWGHKVRKFVLVATLDAPHQAEGTLQALYIMFKWMSEICLEEKNTLAVEYMMCTGAFWVAKVDVYEMLAKENNFGILAIVLETFIHDSL